VQLGLVLGGVYGIGLGTFAIFRGADGALLQAIASTCKVPLLFLLTLTVTFPSLYVFAALQRLPLDVKGTLRLMLLAIVVHLAILASLAPVFAFFAASTDSYAFMLLLNVAVFALGGVLGVMVLRRAAETMFGQLAAKERAPAEPPAQPAPAPADGGGPPALPPPPQRDRQIVDQTRRILGVWSLVYGIVGAQMGWLLRPFLGAPGAPFALFRPREDNVFLGIARALGRLLGQ
jgi:hypothetical protein